MVDRVSEERFIKRVITFLHTFEHSKTSFKVEDVANPGGRKTIRIPLDWIQTYKSMETCSLEDSIQFFNNMVDRVSEERFIKRVI
jgi:hypothetical protein